MLSANTQKIIQCLQRSFNTSARSVAYSALSPLTKPLEDDGIIHEKKAPVEGVQITKLENGITVASCDHGGAVSGVTFALQAGSRVESANQLGLAHCLKNAAFLSNGSITNLGQVRSTQHIGGSLECSSSRELITRKGVALRTRLSVILENIASGISSPVISSWEFDQVVEQCTGDLATLDCAGKNMELLHEAAFRNGLGNSLLCDKLRLGSFSAADLEVFCKQFYEGNRLSIVGTNVEHDVLVNFSKDLLGNLPSGEPCAAATQQYHGGEIRAHTSNGFTYASLVGPGAGLCSANLAAFAVLQRILGQSTSIKWGSNTVSSRLNKAAIAATAETRDPFVVSSLNISYSDAGLFGLHAVSTPSAIGPILKSAIKEFGGVASGKISDEDVTRAKNQVKANVLMLHEGSDDHIDDLVKQVAFTGGYTTPAQTLKNIDAVSLENIVEIANKVFSGKGTLAVTGNSSTALYLDEL